MKRIFVDTSLLLRCYFSFVLQILENCSPVWGSAAECQLQLLELQRVFGGQALSDQSFLSLCHRRRVAQLSVLYKVKSNSNQCQFRELPSASTRVRHPRAPVTAHPLEFEVLRCRTSQFARSFLTAQVQMWDDIPYTLFDTGTPDWFKDAVNRWLFP